MVGDAHNKFWAQQSAGQHLRAQTVIVTKYLLVSPVHTFFLFLPVLQWLPFSLLPMLLDLLHPLYTHANSASKPATTDKGSVFLLANLLEFLLSLCANCYPCLFPPEFHLNLPTCTYCILHYSSLNYLTFSFLPGTLICKSRIGDSVCVREDRIVSITDDLNML